MFWYYLISRIVSAVVCRKMAVVRHRDTNWAIVFALILGWPAIILYYILNDKENPRDIFGTLKQRFYKTMTSMRKSAAMQRQQEKENHALDLQGIESRVEEMLKKRAEEREAKLIPGIRRLKDLGFVKYTPQGLTPIVAISKDFIESIKPFQIKKRKFSIMNDDALECAMFGVGLDFHISIYKEGILAKFGRKGSYFLPFDSSVQFNIVKTYKKIRSAADDDKDFIKIDRIPLDKQLYYRIERHLEGVDTNHYTKSGKIDKRYTNQNDGIRTIWWVEQSLWEPSDYKYSISSSKGWEINLANTLDLNYVYDAFSEISALNGVTLAPLDTLVREEKHNMLELMNDEEKSAFQILLSKEYSSEYEKKSAANDFLRQVISQRQKDFLYDVDDYIKARKVVTGMWSSDCMKALGKPSSTHLKSKTVSSRYAGAHASSVQCHETEQHWEYSNGMKLHFKNEVLIKIDNP